MRVLVAGRNAQVLAKVAGTFSNDLKIATATSKAECFALLAKADFDLIVACETLTDGPGLEVLSHITVNTPNTLRIFAARPATLNLLKGELGMFGLFRTLPYPINFRKLWAAISLARGACEEQAPAAVPAPAPLSAAKAPTPAAVRHPAPAAVPAPRVRHATVDAKTAPARIPESEAFKRARARRDADNKRQADKREPVISNHSLAELAKLAATKRAPAHFVRAKIGNKRTALFVGSGVFAATTLAVLTFFMVKANSSMKPTTLPTIASISQPMPHKVFPWQPETQQPTQQAEFMSSEASPAAVADLEAEAEAASESPDGDPDHPGPPPPDGPPPPSEPPSLESPAQPVNE